jgi:hypothetical protein
VLAVACIAVSVVPVVHSLNRGLWIGLGVAAVYAAVRLALAGRLWAIGALALAGVAVAGALVVTPLGTVVTGGGNGDGTEGVLGKHLIGTYLHGSLLPRNPQVADRMLFWVTGGLPELDTELEIRLHDERLHQGRARGVRKWWQDRMLARG